MLHEGGISKRKQKLKTGGNMAVANIGSEAWCRKAYLNYHCYGNTMGLSPADMGEITQTWSDRLSSWQNSVSNDETEYEFDDSDYASYREDGEQQAKETSGHSGNTDSIKVGGVIDCAGAAAGVGANFLISGNGIASGLMTGNGVKLGTKTLGMQGDKAYQNANSWSIAAPLALATAIHYFANTKKEIQAARFALNTLQGEMQTGQELLTSTQGEMEGYSSELEELSDEALTYNEDTNEELEEQKTEYDMYLQTWMNIQAKIDSGEELTESEKELYESIVGYLQEIGVSIEELSEVTTEEIQALYDEMGAYQDGFDTAAQSMGEIQGLTDFAESFDETTRTMCYVEGVAQGLNAYTGYQSALKAGKFAASGGLFTAWAWAFAAMGTAAGVGSTVATTEQIKWAGEIGTEIDMREATQDLNEETMSVYDEQVDYFAGYMEGVEDLELEIPDDIEAPEGGSVPTGGDDSSGTTPGVTGSSGTSGAGTGNPNKKPMQTGGEQG